MGLEVRKSAQSQLGHYLTATAPFPFLGLSFPNYKRKQ